MFEPDVTYSTHPSHLREQVLKNHVRDMLQGKVLNVEGVVDVLTLKDNTDSIDDYATALHLLASAKVYPSVFYPLVRC